MGQLEKAKEYAKNIATITIPKSFEASILKRMHLDLEHLTADIVRQSSYGHGVWKERSQAFYNRLEVAKRFLGDDNPKVVKANALLLDAVSRKEEELRNQVKKPRLVSQK